MQPAKMKAEEEQSGEEKKESHSSPMSVFQIAETSTSYYDNESAFDVNAVHNTSSNSYSGLNNGSFFIRTRASSFNSSVQSADEHNGLGLGPVAGKIDFSSAADRSYASTRPSSASKSDMLNKRHSWSNNGASSKTIVNGNGDIFKSPVQYQKHPNVNKFDSQNFRWNPTVVKSKHFDRFQTHSDVLWAKKVNEVFDR